MPVWLIIVLAVLLVLIVGGFLARQRQLKRTRPAFERRLAQVERDLAAAAATDRGWDREHLEAAARAIATQRFGKEPEDLTLIEVIDKPGTRPGALIGNIIWVLLFGIWLAIAHVITAVAMAITIIGIPLALADLKLIPISLAPLGKDIVPTRTGEFDHHR